MDARIEGMAEVTAAARVKAYLDVRARDFSWSNDVIAWAVDNTHEEYALTVNDLRELLTENARLAELVHQQTLTDQLERMRVQ